MEKTTTTVPTTTCSDEQDLSVGQDIPNCGLNKVCLLKPGERTPPCWKTRYYLGGVVYCPEPFRRCISLAFKLITSAQGASCGIWWHVRTINFGQHFRPSFTGAHCFPRTKFPPWGTARIEVWQGIIHRYQPPSQGAAFPDFEPSCANVSLQPFFTGYFLAFLMNPKNNLILDFERLPKK